MKIIKINYLTYYFLIVFFLCGLIKNGIIIFVIVFIHELGHFVAAYFNKYKVISITIYPFGGITKLEKDINSPLIKDLFLAVNGVVFQIILFFVYRIFYINGLISLKTFNLFNMYNNLIMIFNLLPIHPLDGANISEIILNKFCSYKKSLQINFFISIIFIIVFIFYNAYYSLNNLLIISFLIVKLIEYKKSIKHLVNKFFLERIFNNYSFEKIKHEKTINLNHLKKNVYYYFWNNDAWQSEKKLLLEKFKLKL